MTRSNDPFEDLPEWKERRRLQEAQELRQRASDEAETYPGSYTAARGDYAPGYDQGGEGESAEWDRAPTQPGYDPAYGAQNPHHHTYQPTDYEESGYGQGFAEAPPAGQAGGYPAENVGWAPSVDHANPVLDELSGRAGRYDEQQVSPQLPPVTSASLDDYRPEAPPAAEPRFGAPPPFFGEAAGGEGGAYQQAGYGEADVEAYDDEYDYDYEEEDDEEGRAYGWKMVAGLVVVGMIVAGGGFFLYDTLAGGGAGGPAPIIKADRGPVKTAPADPGGKSFANQDSKLLGRLDSGAASSRRTALDDEGRNRVREVPTVRVSPDGRLILPNAATSTPAREAGATSEATSVPGINIVDNVGGSSSSLGGQGLPPVVPKSAEPAPRVVTTAPVTTTASSPSQPIIRNGTGVSSSSGENLATARSSRPPPVPQKSAISSAWRMTGTRTAAAPQPASIPRTTSAAATTTASTLGATSVARQSSRQYVAVIATKSSRMAALQSFAELQQRHPATLSNRVPSVQKADLSARGLGTMYRLLVGPAGSRKAANEVCASLKANGYSGCWVKAH